MFDQLKPGVTLACRYEPGLQRTYEERAEHYGTTVLPARPAHPRDKGRVERPIGFVRERFWPGCRPADLMNLNAKAAAWRDPPGLESRFEDHDRITKEYLPRADLVIFCLSTTQPLSAGERDFLLSNRPLSRTAQPAVAPARWGHRAPEAPRARSHPGDDVMQQLHAPIFAAPARGSFRCSAAVRCRPPGAPPRRWLRAWPGLLRDRRWTRLSQRPAPGFVDSRIGQT